MYNFKIYSFVLDHQYNHLALGSKEGEIRIYNIHLHDEMHDNEKRHTELQKLVGSQFGIKTML